jgi:hypothetical protein
LPYTDSIDKINVFELYNGLQKAHQAKPELGLGDALKHVESQYKSLIQQNSQFLTLENTYSPKQAQV